MKMFVSERRQRILELLHDKERLTVKELSKNINVSEATLRTDLNELENEGLLTRTHGGATLNNLNTSDKSFIARLGRNQKEKKIIAEKAISFIEEKQCIALDASSTALELAILLKSSPMRLTVVTSGVQTALELNTNPNLTVILIGGVLTKNSTSIEGLLGVEILEQLTVDVMFTSASGFSLESGLTDFNLYEVQLKKNMVKNSKKIIALVDSTKIGTNSSSSFVKTQDINVFISDSKLPDNEYNKLLDHNVEVIV